MHFKYYAEVKDTRNVKGRQVPFGGKCALEPAQLPDLGCGVCVHLLFSSSNTRYSHGRC